MKIIDLFARQLDREAMPHEVASAEKLLAMNSNFWNLCFRAREVLNREKPDEVYKPKVAVTVPLVSTETASKKETK